MRVKGQATWRQVKPGGGLPRASSTRGATPCGRSRASPQSHADRRRRSAGRTLTVSPPLLVDRDDGRASWLLGARRRAPSRASCSCNSLTTNSMKSSTPTPASSASSSAAWSVAVDTQRAQRRSCGRPIAADEQQAMRPRLPTGPLPRRRVARVLHATRGAARVGTSRSSRLPARRRRDRPGRGRQVEQLRRSAEEGFPGTFGRDLARVRRFRRLASEVAGRRPRRLGLGDHLRVDHVPE